MGSMDELPLEILYHIVTTDEKTWRAAVLSLPFVSRTFEISRTIRKFIKRVVKKEETLDVETYTLCGKLHREDGPALIKRKGEIIKRECWCLMGEKHREDGPAVFVRREIGEFYVGDNRKWYLRNKLVKIVKYTAEGRAYLIEWYDKGNTPKKVGIPLVFIGEGGETFQKLFV